jgi:predicted ABC-type ATPase
VTLVKKTGLMANLLIVTGPPGAGKSTVAALLADRLDRSALVRGDDFFAHLRRGAIDPWLPAADEQNQVVIRAAAAAAGRLVEGGLSTVYDGVLGPRHLPLFVEASGLATVDYVVLLPPLDVTLERVATRTGHGFTDADAAAHMHAEFSRAELEPRHLVGGHGSPADTVDAIEDARSARLLRWSR